MTARSRDVLLSLIMALCCASLAGAQDQERVQIATALSHSRIVANSETVRLWVNVANSSTDQPLTMLRLRNISPSHLEIRAVSWCTPQPAQPLLPSCEVIAPAIQPGARLVAWLDAVVTRPDDFKPVAVVAWDGVDAGERFVGFEALRSVSRVAWFFEPNPLWAIVLPTIGALFTLGVQAYVARRSRVTETWNLMLPESHKNNMKSYIGLTTWSAQTLAKFESLKALGPAKAGDELARRRASMDLVFAIVKVHSGIREMMREPGGLYLKNRLGEELIVHCEKKYREDTLHPWCQKQGHVADATVLMSTILDGIKANESAARFWRKAEPTSASELQGGDAQAARLAFTGAVASLLTHASEWTASPEGRRSMLWLEGRLKLLACEINRPYEAWYRQREWLKLDATIQKLLLEDPEKGEDAARYLDGALPTGTVAFLRGIQADLAKAARRRRLDGFTRG